jgi:hypothetical protein
VAAATAPDSPLQAPVGDDVPRWLKIGSWGFEEFARRATGRKAN